MMSKDEFKECLKAFERMIEEVSLDDLSKIEFCIRKERTFRGDQERVTCMYRRQLERIKEQAEEMLEQIPKDAEI